MKKRDFVSGPCMIVTYLITEREVSSKENEREREGCFVFITNTKKILF